MSLSAADAHAALVARWHALDPDEKACHLRSFDFAYAYHSGKIEDDAITYRDARELFEHRRVVSYTGEVRPLLELENLRLSWEWLLGHADPALVVDEALVLEAHRLICFGTYDDARMKKGERPGTYKRHDYRVGPDLAVGLPPEEVPAAMRELVAEVADGLGALAGAQPSARADRNALAVAAYLHAMLVEVHPFADGNGRVARLLTNLVLVSRDLPPVAIDERDRMAYYGALDAFHLDRDLAALVSLLEVETLTSWPSLSAA